MQDMDEIVDNIQNSRKQTIELCASSAQTIMDKLAILTDAAKYDVACTSSGVDRKGNGVSGYLPQLLSGWQVHFALKNINVK